MKVYPLLQSQLAIYCEWEIAPKSTQYNLPFVYKFPLIYTTESLKQAIIEIAEVHPQLYTRYKLDEDGEICQYVDRASLSIEIITTREDKIAELKGSFVQAFDLLNESAARFKVVQTEEYTYLLHDIHHISFDGISYLYLKKELEAALTAGILLGERKSVMEAVAVEQSMRESASESAKESVKESAKLSEDAAYFQELLSQAPSISFLTKKKSEHSTSQVDKFFINNKAAFAFCKEHKLNVNSLLITAFSIVASRFSGEQSALFGVLHHGRKSKEWFPTFGMFVRTMPLVLSVDSTKNIIEQIKENQLAQKELWQHQSISLSEIINQFGIELSVSFAYQKVVDESFPFALSSERLAVDSPQGLSIEVLETVDSFEIRATYIKESYDEDMIRTFCNAYIICLNNIISSPDAICSQIGLISKGEGVKLLDLAYGGDLAYDRSATFIDVFHKNVKISPEKIAVVAENGDLTYQTLDTQSNILASKLIELGVVQDSFVAIMLPRVKEFMISTLAVFKSGGAYLPLDIEYPNDRLLYMLEDSQAKVLITTRAFFEQKQKEGEFKAETILFVDEFDFSSSGYSTSSKAINNSTPNSLSYMIYTSGSTGNPKGVMIAHKSLLAYLSSWKGEAFEIQSSDRISCHPSFSFDASIVDLFGSLYSGATLYIIPSSLRQDIAGLSSYLTENQITGGTYSTQFGMELLNSFDLSFRYIYLGGEKLKAVKFSTVNIVNGYGPTEFTVCSCAHTVNQQKDVDNIPIGRPLQNTWSYVLDANKLLVPQGVAGELCLSGCQIARGYWKREELTAEKFVVNPYSSCEDNSVMYCTGDLVRWNTNGELEYLGRIDNQVKLRGFRIELGEIESAISKYKGVQSAVVHVKDIAGSQHLCAYYTADIEIDKELLRDSLSVTLTEYMLPSVYIQLNNLPLTPNGKIDIKSLPSPEFTPTSIYTPPRNPVEVQVCEIFTQILQVEKVGVDDSFFALGGDSIKAIRCVSRLRNAGYELSVSVIMKQKTVRLIAEEIIILGNQLKGEQDQEIEGKIEGKVPLTFIQSYFFDLGLAYPAHFNQSVLFESSMRLDTDILQSSLKALVNHHDMLRAYYVGNKQFVKSSKEDNLFELFTYDLRSSSDWQIEMEAKANSLQSRSELSNACMMRIALFHTVDRDYLLVIIHHLVIDGISWRILSEDLNLSYQQLSRKDPLSLPAKTVSFKRWSEAVVEYRDSFKLSQEIPYWQKIEQQLPIATKREVIPINRTFSINESITKELLTQTSAAYHTEINDLLLTALCRSFAKAMQMDTLSVTLEGHGREPIGKQLPIDRTLGWFTTAFPVLFSKIGRALRQDIRRVKETIRSIPNHGVGCGILQYIGDPILEKNRETTVAFNYLGELSEQSSEDTIFTMNFTLPQGSASHPDNFFGSSIAFNGLIADKSLKFYITYNSLLYTNEQMQCLEELFIEEIDAIVKHCKSVKVPEYTASDFGELAWDDKLFSQITSKLASKDWSLERIYPLTPMQEGMLFQRISAPDSRAYHLQNRFKSNVRLSEEQIRQSMHALGLKHEVLRTSIIYKDLEHMRQVILLGRDFEITSYDLTESKDLISDIETIEHNDLRRGFDLQEDSLMRVALIQCPKNESRLLFSAHHIIVDGWCIGLYMSDFVNYLSTVFDGGVLKDISASRYHYETLVREILSKNVGTDYWHNLLGDYSISIGIPSYELKDDEFEEINYIKPVGLELTKGLNRLCKETDVTINTLIEAVWGIILQSYNRCNDVVFGKVVSGRNHSVAGIEEMVGLFINTIPIRVKTYKEDTIIDLLKRLYNQGVDSSQYDYYPLSEVQQESDLGSDLIQTIFAFENYYVNESSQTDSLSVSLESERIREETSFGLSVIAYQNIELYLGFSTNNQKYTQSEIECLWKQTQLLLSHIVENPIQQISSYSIISDEEKDGLLDLAYGGELEYDRSETFIDIFYRNVNISPDKIAVVAENGELTYQTLETQSNILASKLIELGVVQDSFVAIMLPRVKEFMISTLAVFKSGGAYVPLDVEYPNDRLLYMLEDSQAKVLITTRAFFEQKQKEGEFKAETILFVDEFGSSSSDTSTSSKSIDNSLPESLSYMIYTSGSTGNPKGVMISHKSLLAYLRSWKGETFEIQTSDRISCHPSFSFDASIVDLYGSIYSGATLYIVPSSLRQDIAGLSSYLSENQITGGTYSTQFGMELLNSFDLAFRYIYLGGEKLKAVKFSTVNIVNGYGPTEFTVCSCAHTVNQQINADKAADKAADNIPIGRPLQNTWSYVLDGNKLLVPQGVAGELCLSGCQIARGYWKRDELTAEKFVENPYSTCEDNRVIYCTGDLVRWNANGELEYLGRIDNQIKLRGFRIELGEIESVISKYKGIHSVVVDVKEVGGSQHLCAYYTAEQEIDNELLRTYLSRSLTDYMVPTLYTHLDNLPLTPNGKLDKKALPSPEIDAGEIVAPRNKMEQLILGAVQRLLGITHLSVTTNLFVAGLNSMNAIKLTVQLKNELDISVNYTNIFKYQTVEQLSSFLLGEHSSDSTEQMIKEITDYDYTAIDSVLARNNISALQNVSGILKIEENLDSILLTGATKYWGIHLLYTFLTEYTGKVYCLAPSHQDTSAQQWLQQLLFYYFDRDFHELIDTRLFVIEGDIADEESIKNLDLPISHIINCDSNNSHFVSGDDLIQTNIKGVEHLIAYCKKRQKPLIHLSTRSVTGFMTAEILESRRSFGESNLYIGQTHENEYTYSKFMAERLILESIAKGDIQAKIMREGNMMPRSSDGEFQIDADSNSFVKRLKAFKMLKAFPISMLAAQADLSPMDEMAVALLRLIGTADQFTVFNVCNTHTVPMGDLIYAMRDYGFTIDIVSDSTFDKCLSEAMKNTENLHHLSGILAYETQDNETALLHEIDIDMTFTTMINYYVGNRWSPISKDYLYQMIEKLDGLGFFDEEILN